MSDYTLAEQCAVACAEAFRGDGEILASPIGVIPSLGARLARATFAPDLLLTDGAAFLVRPHEPGAAQKSAPQLIEGWLPYRAIFDLVWSGRRHVMMGASQLDRHGNQNISCIGEFTRPRAQLIGMRGAPGNTVSHTTSYFIPNHSPRTLVPRVDVVCGVGYDRAKGLGPAIAGWHELRVVVTNKAVLDFETPDHGLRLRSVHRGCSVEDIRRNTGFPLHVPTHLPETRAPTSEELRLLREVLDPAGLADKEVSS
jgi:acyl CoA:acetate/3-ketoacid CoA transferase beta subunit